MKGTKYIMPYDTRQRILSEIGWDSYNQVEKLNRFKIVHPDHVFEHTVGYIFMTKPDLNIFKSHNELNTEFKNRYEFTDMTTNQSDINILKQLQLSAATDNGFINMITNSAENFDTSDDVLKTDETAAAFMGWTVVYGGTSVESRKADTLSISYTDDRAINLYKLHSTWIEYINLVKRGFIHSKSKYIYNRILDYASSLFYFLVGEDGEKIIYASKYTGVFPTNIPNSAFSWARGDSNSPKYTISYQYNFKEDMKLSVICSDFNNIALTYGKKGNGELIRNPKTGRTGTHWLSNAKIVTDGKNFRLQFIK